MNLHATVHIFEQMLNFSTDYREGGFDNALFATSELAKQLNMSADDMVLGLDESVLRRGRERKKILYECEGQPKKT